MKNIVLLSYPNSNLRAIVSHLNTFPEKEQITFMSMKRDTLGYWIADKIVQEHQEKFSTLPISSLFRSRSRLLHIVHGHHCYLIDSIKVLKTSILPTLHKLAQIPGAKVHIEVVL